MFSFVNFFDPMDSFSLFIVRFVLMVHKLYVWSAWQARFLFGMSARLPITGCAPIKYTRSHFLTKAHPALNECLKEIKSMIISEKVRSTL